MEDQSYPSSKGTTLESALSDLHQELTGGSEEHWGGAGRSQERAGPVPFIGSLAFPCPEAEGQGCVYHTLKLGTFNSCNDGALPEVALWNAKWEKTGEAVCVLITLNKRLSRGPGNISFKGRETTDQTLL